MSYNEIKNMLEKYNQTHLLNHFEKLSLEEQQELLEQIKRVDFELMNKLHLSAVNGIHEEVHKIEPIEAVVKNRIPQEEKKELERIGEISIRNGELAFVTMAGGQGTRLGHKGPKGTYVLDVDNNKSLFELLCDTLKAAREKYNVTIPWYIMTSRENDQDTKAFFEANSYFNYGKDNIKFFVQGELPMLLENGNVVLESLGKIKFASDGHGGIFEAMLKNGIVQDMKSKNIKWVFIGGVDNCLLKMVDPLFIGLCEKGKYMLGSKTVVKSSPQEKVGAFCKKDGKVGVVEYTEITEEMANLRNTNGDLVFGEAHILCNMFSIDILERMGEVPLKHHTAHKSTSFIDEQGNLIESDIPNAYKFETLIFDAFKASEDILLLRTNREEEFAPVKNKEGVDSPETARKLFRESRLK